jgi:UDP:flavonoid glycosyltransferase YjiC (YdhE family)
MQNRLFESKPLLMVFPFDVMAHYLRCLQLAKYLEPWFDIKFLYSSRYHSFVSEAGFETFEATSLDADKVQQCVRSFDFSWLNDKDLSDIYRQQVKVINKLKPTIVLGDMAPTLKMAAEKTNVYYLSLINGYLSKHYAYVRRMPRSYPLYKLFNILPKSVYTYFTNIGEHIYFHDIHRPFSKIRKRAGLSPKHSYMQELEGDLNLICDLPELFPQKDLPENYLFVPPLFHKASSDGDAIINKLDTNKKTLFVNMGSTGDWTNVSFLNDSKYYNYNIVTAGDKDEVIRGPHVVSYPFVNDSRLFNIVDLVICHGGNGTCYQSFSFGIPVLSITSHFEQEYNVEGVERCGLGKSFIDVPDNNYLDIIENLIERKRNNEFDWIKQNIAQTKDLFKRTLPQTVVKILNNQEVTINV